MNQLTNGDLPVVQKERNRLLEAALYFQREGLPIFPVHFNDHPDILRWKPEEKQREILKKIKEDPTERKRKSPLVLWEQYQTRVPTEAEVTQWWTDWPDAGIAMATGRLSGLFVVDAEYDAEFSLFGLVGLDTPTAKSGGGGWHWYFSYPSNRELRNTVEKLAPNYDTRGEGGYILLPPSPHESGVAYAWDIPLKAVDPMPIPENILQRLAGGTESRVKDLLAGVTTKGSRNNNATSVVGKFLRQMHPKEWESVVWPTLQAWNATHAKPPLSEGELRGIYESIGRREQERRGAEGGVEESKSGGIAQELVQLAQENGTEFYRDDRQEPFVRFQLNGHWEVWPLRSRSARQWLQYIYWQRQQYAVRGDALTQAMGTLEAIAVNEGKKRRFANRVVRTSDDSLWYDLTDDEWRVVRITADGWSIETAPPALFRRYSHQRAQVQPERGGDPWELRRFVNVADDQQFLLFLVLVISCFIPDFPHPIPIVYGSHGAAKTMALRVARMLIDPSSTGVPRFPKQPEALIQTLAHNWFAPFDNVDKLSQDASDTICAAVTGLGFSKRALYTDDEDFHYAFKHCVGLNGINLVGSNADLLDRSILFQLDRIPKEQRRDEAVFLKEFSAALPGILGGCLDVLSKALTIHPSITLKRKPRMADFALWGCAITEALGNPRRVFLDAYEASISSQNEELLDEHPVAVAILYRVVHGREFEGNATELHRELKEVLKEIGGDDGARQLPKNPAALSKELNKIRSNLADAGVSIERLQRTGRTRLIRIWREENAPVAPVTASGGAEQGDWPRDGNVTADDGDSSALVSLQEEHNHANAEGDDSGDRRFLEQVRGVFPDARFDD